MRFVQHRVMQRALKIWGSRQTVLKIAWPKRRPGVFLTVPDSEICGPWGCYSNRAHGSVLCICKQRLKERHPFNCTVTADCRCDFVNQATRTSSAQSQTVLQVNMMCYKEECDQEEAFMFENELVSK